MTDKLPSQVLTEEQISAISGGTTCDVNQIFTAIGNLTSAYESLVDFTSHVIERVMQ